MSTTELSARDADPILRMHDSSARGAMQTIASLAGELETSLNGIDLRIDALPDAVAAVRADLFSEKAINRLHRLTAEVITLANAIHTRATTIRQLGTHGRTQLEQYGTRLRDVEQVAIAGIPTDEDPITGEYAEESE